LELFSKCLSHSDLLADEAVLARCMLESGFELKLVVNYEKISANRSVMTRFIALFVLTFLVVGGGVVFAQGFPPAWPPLVWSNFPGPWGTNIWWTNVSRFTNQTVSATNSHPKVVPPGVPASALSQTPPDVQNVIKQFQQSRNQLISQMQSASAAQRQQIMQQAEQLREKMQQQLQNLREQALDQANAMRNQFQNSRDVILNQGVTSPSSNPGKPR
jgi:vacuolar-type H+-ATPase subunit H